MSKSQLPLDESTIGLELLSPHPGPNYGCCLDLLLYFALKGVNGDRLGLFSTHLQKRRLLLGL